MTTRCIVLLGIGHTNALFVRQWMQTPIADCRLVCISNFEKATYSGMLPGALAGQFSKSEMEIDLAALCKKANAQLVLAEVDALELDLRKIHFSSRAPLTFDVLAIGIGSVPAGAENFDSASFIPIKPMQTFLERLDRRLEQLSRSRTHSGDGVAKIAIVGGGVASVEIALCLQPRLKKLYRQMAATIGIYSSSETIAPELGASGSQRISKLLNARGIDVATGTKVVSVAEDEIELSDGTRLPMDCVLWSTGADSPPLLERLGLPTDDRGFLATDATLQSTAGRPVFAVGDSGSIIGHPAPKAGVYAVRQFAPLWHNVQAILEGRKLQPFVQQREFLKLLNTADGKAILHYRGFLFHGRWCWWLKTLIDKRFVKKFQFK